MAKIPAKRLSISIPAADTRCLEWLKSQSNVSSALRFLIHDALSRWGTRDVVYDVMPAAIAAVSERRAVSKRFNEQLQQETVSTQEKVEQPVKQQELQQAPPPPVRQPVQPQVQPVEEDDDSYFVDPAQFL